MKHLHRILSLILGAILLMAPLLPGPIHAQGDTAARFYELLTTARLKQGLAPLSRSTLLDQAAQRHATDIAERGVVSSTGADGSTFRQRIRETGYHAWNDGLLVNELIWTGSGGAENALKWFQQNSQQWAMFLDPKYREIGLGFASDAQGMQYFVITVGSRPGVLPVFINDGAESTESPQVAIRLTNEEAVSMGEGTWMGKAIEVRLSSSPDFGNTPWQPWGSLLPWSLDDNGRGEYIVYVQFRDGAKRTAISQASIQLKNGSAPRPTATPTVITPTPGTATPTPAPTFTPTPVPTDIPTSTPTPTLEPAAPTYTPVPDQPTPTPTATPWILPTATATATPILQPTWTPLPDGQIEPTATIDWPLWGTVGLQIAALLLGAAIFLRRK